MYNLLTYLKYPQLLNVRHLTPNIVRCLTPNIVLPISLVWLLATQIWNPFCKRSHSYQLVLDIFSTDFKKHMPLARTPQIIYKKEDMTWKPYIFKMILAKKINKKPTYKLQSDMKVLQVAVQRINTLWASRVAEKTMQDDILLEVSVSTLGCSPAL